MISPPSAPRLTAQAFVDQRYDLPEGGRWTELHAGTIVTLSPPDDLHGNVVRNLSRELGLYVQSAPQGYACFELGLILRRNPDSVYCPPICYFTQGERFAEADKIATDTVPQLVIEIASTSDRRQNMEERIQDYWNWGVATVWVIDAFPRQAQVCHQHQMAQTLQLHEFLNDESILPGFSCAVKTLFEDPPWWKTPGKPPTSN